MPNSNDIKPEHVRALIIGDAGTHKTYFLATIPDIFVFDFDVGMSIARGMNVEYETFKDQPRHAIGAKKTPGLYSYGGAWPKFISRLNEIGLAIDDGKWNRPIAFDSLTTFANCAMAYVLNSTNYIGNPQIQHWGAQMDLVEMTIAQLASWPIPFFVTAHIQRDKNEITQSINEYLPLVTGKLAGKLCIYFDEVWYTSIVKVSGKQVFTLKTESDIMYKQAKSRGGLKDGIEATWPAVASKLKENAPTP